MFQLAKVWVDNTPNTHTVEIRCTWSKRGEPPSWNGREEAEVMSVVPNTNPSMRLAVIEIPRYLDHEPSYLLHYRFGGGGEFHDGLNHDFTEEIVSREVEYVDNEGLITEMRALWGVGGWSAPNWSQAKLRGLKLNMLEHETGRDAEGEGMADEAIYELVQTVPLPRRFVARIWGPKGATVEYAFQLLRTNSPMPESDFARWDQQPVAELPRGASRSAGLRVGACRRPPRNTGVGRRGLETKQASTCSMAEGRSSAAAPKRANCR